MHQVGEWTGKESQEPITYDHRGSTTDIALESPTSRRRIMADFYAPKLFAHNCCKVSGIVSSRPQVVTNGSPAIATIVDLDNVVRSDANLSVNRNLIIHRFIISAYDPVLVHLQHCRRASNTPCD